jgi:hypothetical protein
VLYQRVPRLFSDLALARGDGRHPRLLRALGRVDVGPAAARFRMSRLLVVDNNVIYTGRCY